MVKSEVTVLALVQYASSSCDGGGRLIRHSTFHRKDSIPCRRKMNFDEPDWCDDKDAQIFISTIITLVSTLKFVGVKVFLRENLHSSWDNLNTHKVLISVMIVEMRNCASLLSHQSGSSEESSFFCKICGYAVLPVECLYSLPPQSQEEDAYCTCHVMSSWFITR